MNKKLQKLSEQHPPPSQARIERYMPRLNKLRLFYEEKAPDAPKMQGYMFIGFVNAIVYAADIIEKYTILTKRLARLAKEEEDETRTNR